VRAARLSISEPTCIDADFFLFEHRKLQRTD
jgi:hypothetical protein